MNAHLSVIDPFLFIPIAISAILVILGFFYEDFKVLGLFISLVLLVITFAAVSLPSLMYLIIAIVMLAFTGEPGPFFLTLLLGALVSGSILLSICLICLMILALMMTSCEQSNSFIQIAWGNEEKGFRVVGLVFTLISGVGIFLVF
jgi:hypothetical protein